MHISADFQLKHLLGASPRPHWGEAGDLPSQNPSFPVPQGVKLLPGWGGFVKNKPALQAMGYIFLMVPTQTTYQRPLHAPHWVRLAIHGAENLPTQSPMDVFHTRAGGIRQEHAGSPDLHEYDWCQNGL